MRAAKISEKRFICKYKKINLKYKFILPMHINYLIFFFFI